MALYSLLCTKEQSPPYLSSATCCLVRPLSPMIPTFREFAFAVIGRSPVTITTFNDARALLEPETVCWSQMRCRWRVSICVCGGAEVG